MKKRVLVIFLVILLLSTCVHAFSVREFLEDFGSLFTGKVVSNTVEKRGFFSLLIESITEIFKKKEIGKDLVQKNYKNTDDIFKEEVKEGSILTDNLFNDPEGEYNYVYDDKTGQTYVESYNRTQKPTYYGYIIQFKEPSLIEKQTELKNKKLSKQQINNQLQDYNQELNNKHIQYKLQLKNNINDFDNKLIGEYSKVFNGVALSIDEWELSNIRNLDFVKKISYNYQTESVLEQSIPIINADDVWNLGYTGQGINITIIDTGIDYTHRDLDEGKVIEEHCYCSYLGGCCPNGGIEQHGVGSGMDDNGHGTHCAGIASSDGDSSGGMLKGVAPDTNLISIKVLNSYGIGLMSDVVAAIEKSVDPNEDGNFNDHYNIISMSVGGFYPEMNSFEDPTAIATNNAVEVGVVAVAAVGNMANLFYEYPSYGKMICPGCAQNAITIGATDKEDIIAGFSSRGPSPVDANYVRFPYGDEEIYFHFVYNNTFILKPDLVAPGVSICSSRYDNIHLESQCYDEEHIYIMGTSMATPHVSGAVALLKQKYPNLSPIELKSIIKENTIQTSILKNVGLYYIPTPMENIYYFDEFCKKSVVGLDSLYATIFISDVGGYLNDDFGNLTLRAVNQNNPNIPGYVILTKPWEKYFYSSGKLYLKSNIGEIPLNYYWICGDFSDYGFGVIGTEYSNNELDLIYNYSSGLWNEFNGDISIRLFSIKYNKSNVLTQGTGRLDILKSVINPFFVIPSSLEFFLNDYNNEVIKTININNLNNNSVSFNVSIKFDNNDQIRYKINNHSINTGENILRIKFYNLYRGFFTGILLFESFESNYKLRVPFGIYYGSSVQPANVTYPVME